MINKESFNKENIPDLFSQIVKICERDGKTPELKTLVKNLKKLSADIQLELKKSKIVKKDELEETIQAKVKKILKSKPL